MENLVASRTPPAAETFPRWLPRHPAFHDGTPTAIQAYRKLPEPIPRSGSPASIREFALATRPKRRDYTGPLNQQSILEPQTDPRGYVFSPDSEIWQVNRYACGLLFGPAAVLLQVAHPRIAQGVADHSNYREDALGRLRRTLTTVNRIAFGTHREAEQMRERLSATHARVQGKTSHGMPGPSRYSAFEPDLMFWVLATLIDASIKGYELVWGPLASPRREILYREFRQFGAYFGLGEQEGPANYREFTDYFEEMLTGGILGSHPLCAEVAAAVVRPARPLRDRLLGRALDFLSIENVPEPLRSRLKLSSTGWTRLRMAATRRLAPLAFRVLPRRWAFHPEAYRAERRLGIR